MNELTELILLVIGLFATISGLLYVLTVLDPQTQRTAALDERLTHN